MELNRERGSGGKGTSKTSSRNIIFFCSMGQSPHLTFPCFLWIVFKKGTLGCLLPLEQRNSSKASPAPHFGISVSSNLYCCSSLIKSIVHSKRVTRTLSFYSTCISFVFSRFFHNLIIIAITLWGQLTCINQLGLSSLTRFFTVLLCPWAS